MRSRILVVDDDPAARRILVLALRPVGDVLEASSGEEALRLIASEKPRVMLLDMTMPGMSGLDVLKAAQHSPSPMTILVLTGVTDIGQAKRALDLGALEFITKPFDLVHLREKVKSCLARAPGGGKSENGAPWRTQTLDRWEDDGGSFKGEQMENKTAVKIMTKETLNEKLKRGDKLQVLNVLDAQYYALGVIKGSKMIPLAELEKRSSELDKAVEVVTYCASIACDSSRKAAEMLAGQGFNASAYEGGIKEWVEAKLPVEPASSTATPVAASV